MPEKPSPAAELARVVRSNAKNPMLLAAPGVAGALGAVVAFAEWADHEIASLRRQLEELRGNGGGR